MSELDRILLAAGIGCISFSLVSLALAVLGLRRHLRDLERLVRQLGAAIAISGKLPPGDAGRVIRRASPWLAAPRGRR